MHSRKPRVLSIVILFTSFFLFGGAVPHAGEAASPGHTIDFLSSVGGRVKSVAVEGSLAYLGEGSRLTVLDVSDPQQPALLSSIYLGGALHDLLVSGTSLYVVNAAQGLQILDVSDPSRPMLQGSYPLAGTPGALYLENGLVYLAAGDAGLCIIEVSDPAHPGLQGKYAGLAYDVWVQGSYAYLAAGDLSVLDVSEPAHPSLQLSFPTEGEAQDLYLANNKLYLATGLNLTVVDISDPLHPVRQGSYLNGEPILDVYVLGDLAYLLYASSEIPFITPDWTCNLKLLDITDSANLILSGEFVRPSYEYQSCDGSVQVVAGRAYLAIGAGLGILDVSVPSDPRLLGLYPSTQPDGIWPAQNLLYAADRERGLQVFDMSAPLQPDLLTSYTRPGAFDVQVVGNTAYVAAVEPSHAHFPGGQLLMLDVSDPRQPVLAAELILRAYDMQIDGRWAYLLKGVSGFTSVLTILDMGDPSDPQTYLDGYRPFPTNTWPPMRILAAEDGYVYVIVTSSGSDELYILDARAPWSPLLRSSLLLDASVSQLQVLEKTVYLATSVGMQVLDVGDPDNPQILTTYPAGDQLHALHVLGDTAYLAAGMAGIQILDVSDPANPALQASYPDIDAQGIEVSGDLLYVRDGAGGLVLLRYAPRTSALIGTAGGELLSPDGATSSQFPPAAFAGPVTIMHTALSGASLPPPGDYHAIGQNFELRAVDASGQPAQPLAPYTLTVQYTDQARGPAIESTLALYYWHGSGWLPEPSSSLDPEANVLTATPDHLSLWAVLGQSGKLYMPVVSTGQESVLYRGYTSDGGWTAWSSGVETVGAAGSDQHLEALQIRLGNALPGLVTEYQVHLQNIGWMDWLRDGQIAGLPGSGLQIEAVRIRLVNAPSGYRLSYQAYVEEQGWLEGVFDGEIAGTSGESRPMQALRIQLLMP